VSTPSELVRRHAATLAAVAREAPVVDLACGRGRNALALARAGVAVLGLDRSAEHLDALCRAARAESLPVRALRADLETAPHPPLARGRLGALLVCRYLHRPLAPVLAKLLRPGGWLLYETFTLDQRELGYGPRNPDFLLEPGELPRIFAELEVVEHWEGLDESGERPAALARLVARRPPSSV